MIGNNIRKALEIKGITSNELAKKIDVSATYISYLLNNKRNASIETLEKIAKVLGCKVSDLFDDKEVSNGGETEEVMTLARDMKCEPSEFYDDAINKEIDLFTTRLVKELLDANMIKDVEHIPPEITDMLLKALVLDYKKKKDAKN